MGTRLRTLIGDKSGATSIEYGLIAALMAVVIVVVFSLIGPHLRTAFDQRGADMAEPQDVTAG